MKHKLLFGLFYLMVSAGAFASDIKSVAVLTDQIIVINFSDGYIKYHSYHQKGAEDETIKDELNIPDATNSSNYVLISSDDSDYNQPSNPVRIGRKSKPCGMSMRCMPNDKNACMSDYVLEHYIYLILFKPLKPGKTYTIATGKLAKNTDRVTLKYDPLQTRSLAVHVNQLGFVPTAKVKYAYLSHWMGDVGPLELAQLGPVKFHIIRTKDGKKVFSGPITKQRDFKTSGSDCRSSSGVNLNFVAADVWQCDFSSFSESGEYLISVDRMGISFPFKIDNNIYQEPFILTCRSLYHHRSGITLKEPYTHYEREAPHNPNLTPGFKLCYTKFRNMDSKMESHTLIELEAMFDDSVDTRNMWGWYQDAGDWDAYITHAVVPAYLMTTFELKPLNFSDGQLNIPESGNGIPDILDEASWLIYHYRRTKGLTGGNAGARIEGDHYPAKEAGHGLPSYEDIRGQWIVYGEEPRLTFIYAKLAAQLAYCYKKASANKQFGKNINAVDSIALWKSEAIKAYNWAQNNLRDGDEPKVKGERASAEAWMYKLTEDLAWLDKFRSGMEVIPEDISKFDDYKWGIWSYVTASEKSKGYDIRFKKDLVKATELYAQQEVTQAIVKNRSFRLGGRFQARNKVGQASVPMVLPAIMAWEVTHKPEYMNAVYTTADYVLGGNPLDITWVTGLGDQHPLQVFNMDWWYNKKGIKEVIPGIIPYGPIEDCDAIPGKNGDCNSYGWWDSDYAHMFCYPDKSQWPLHERWYNNRYAPTSAEYTIHECIAPAVMVYGYLIN